MPSRDAQTVLLSRQALLLVTAVGVSLLTLSYVLGVQVGKQSAALRHGQLRSAGEDLEALPASVAEQLKAIERSEAAFAKGRPPIDPPAAKPTEPAKAEEPKPAKAEAPKAAKAEAPKAAEPAPAAKAAASGRWTLQLVSTPDLEEARRMVAKAKDAGFQTTIVNEKGLHKVRLAAPASREAVETTAQRLKARGFRTFAIHLD